jgi:hypothetical protein
VLHPEELSRPVGGFAQRHDPRVTDDLFERHQIAVVAWPMERIIGDERDCVFLKPGNVRKNDLVANDREIDGDCLAFAQIDRPRVVSVYRAVVGHPR